MCIRDRYQRRVHGEIKMNYMTKDEWISPSPSKKDGLTEEEEIYIMFEARIVLKEMFLYLKNYPNIIIFKAMVLFHKYLRKYSVKKLKWHRYLVVTACLFLAAKLDDCSIKMSDMSLIYLKLIAKKKKLPETKLDANTISELEKKICLCEKDILHEIGFNLEIDLPFVHIQKYRKYPCVDISRIVDVAQIFCDDSFLSPVCLYYHPVQIACCSIYWASLFFKSPLPSHGSTPWYKFLNPQIEMEQILEISEFFRKIYHKVEKAILEQRQTESSLKANNTPEAPTSFQLTHT
eukprot:TRINITY_DN4342_c0_g1_i1.p1 TRINITY_DN4342_c0_g1~~TRINITY_DN4342_c0_g1_i1.p1  ORF type:complete len:291 (+),score=40.80 TRINITY_DN4342_c0_g1_i1:77-949(+)